MKFFVAALVGASASAIQFGPLHGGSHGGKPVYFSYEEKLPSGWRPPAYEGKEYEGDLKTNYNYSPVYDKSDPRAGPVAYGSGDKFAPDEHETLNASPTYSKDPTRGPTGYGRNLHIAPGAEKKPSYGPGPAPRKGPAPYAADPYDGPYDVPYGPAPRKNRDPYGPAPRKHLVPYGPAPRKNRDPYGPAPRKHLDPYGPAPRKHPDPYGPAPRYGLPEPKKRPEPHPWAKPGGYGPHDTIYVLEEPDRKHEPKHDLFVYDDPYGGFDPYALSLPVGRGSLRSKLSPKDGLLRGSALGLGS